MGSNDWKFCDRTLFGLSLEQWNLEFDKLFEREIKKELAKSTNFEPGPSISFDIVHKPNYESLIPTRVIFNDRTTICFWPDGTKTRVTCAENEQFIEEMGVAECIIRKVFEGNRSQFLKIVENAYRSPTKAEKEAWRNEKKTKLKEKGKLNVKAQEEEGASDSTDY